MKALLIAFLLSLIAPACLVHSYDRPVPARRVAYYSAPRCHPSRYWDGERCVKKGRGHHKHHHNHGHDDD